MNRQHDCLQRIQTVNNKLVVAKAPVDQWVDVVGGTPCYIYDRQAMTDRVGLFRQRMPSGLKLHYAIKANPMSALVSHLAGLVDGFDVASQQELGVAISAGMRMDAISFAGPAKREPELVAAIAAGVVINVESPLELERLAVLSQRLQRKAKVALRINANFELKSGGMKMSGGAKPFGIDAEMIPNLLAEMDLDRLDFRGFHIYAGSQNLNPVSLVECYTETFALAERLCRVAPCPVQHINIGGGLGIPYFPGDKALDLKPVAVGLEQLMAARTAAFAKADIIMELGRWLVGEAGYYVCRVIDRKISRGKTYLITDGGLHHHLANSGNLGQVIRKNYPLLIGNRVSAEPTETIDIAGPLCTPLDILGTQVTLPTAEPGDLLVVLQSGAYGATASPQAFLGHPPARELLV